MNSTGAGELNTYEVGNIKEADAPNYQFTSSNTQTSTGSATFIADSQAIIHFYSSGGPIEAIYDAGADNSASNLGAITISVDSVGVIGNDREFLGNGGGALNYQSVHTGLGGKTYSQGTHTIQGYFRSIAGTTNINQRSITAEEK